MKSGISKQKIAKDTIALAAIKIFGMITGMVSAMIITRQLSKETFALYSQSITITGLISSFSIMGLGDAVIYFYNKADTTHKKRRYVNCIFSIVLLIGLLSAGAMLLCRDFFSKVMNNQELALIIFYCMFRPLLSNLSVCFTNLYFTIDQVKRVSIRNLIYSVATLLIAIIIGGSNTPVKLYWILTLSLDLILIVLYWLEYYHLTGEIISPLKLKKEDIAGILKYALPLGAAIICSTLLKEFDKILISMNCSLEDYATYAAVSRQLPVTIFAGVVGTIVIPKISLSYQRNDHATLRELLQGFYHVCAYSCILLGTAMLCVSEELLEFLYSAKYINGLSIFIVYLFVDIAAFTYPGMLLTISGHSKSLLKHTCFALILNIIISYVLLMWIGILGPAIGTLIVQTGMFVLQSFDGCKKIHEKFLQVFPWKRIAIAFFKCTIVACLLSLIKQYVEMPYLPKLLLFGASCFGLQVLLTLNDIKFIIKYVREKE